MSTPVFTFLDCSPGHINLHSLNNEGGEGNQIQTRIVTIVDADGRLHSVNAISGDMLKHIQAEHLYRIARISELPLCQACAIFDANRMSADPDFPGLVEGEAHAGAGGQQAALLYAG